MQGDSLPSEPHGKPKNTGLGSLSLLQWIFPTQEPTGVSCIASRFFTNWAIREAYCKILANSFNSLKKYRVSLAVQWLRILLPMRRTWIQSLVQEDSTHHRATKPCTTTTKPRLYSSGAGTTGTMCLNYGSPRPWSLWSVTREAAVTKSTHHNYRVAPLTATRESLCAVMKTQHRQIK